MKNGNSTSIPASVEQLFTRHIDQLNIDCHEWRLTKLWTKECDETFTRLMPFIKKIYEKYSGANNLPGTPKYMSLDEFI
jgi:hypothetical protein